MVIPRTSLLCTLTLLCVLAPLSPAQGRDALSQNRRLGRGVNIIGYDRIWRSRAEGRFQDRHFRLLKEAGFQTVRINLHPFRHMDPKQGYALSPAWCEVLDWAVDGALAQDLRVILDLHEFNAIAADPEARKPMFLAFWRQLAARCAERPDSVLFEILNEPNRKLTPALWNQWLAEALGIIRTQNPTRTVIVGPAFWNAIDHLDELDLPAGDRNLIVTVHYYKPMAFTHQGASWSSHRDRTGVPWLGSAADLAAINSDFDRAQAWSRRTGRPLFLGEFGAYDRAEMPSRVRWTAAVARAAEARGWSWAYWQFDSDFILYDIDADHWVEPIRDALIPPPGAGADWPNWRGPEHNGISRESRWSRTWPADGPTELWRRQVGTGFASVAVAHGRLYTMGNTGRKGDGGPATQQDVVTCLDAATGDLLWEHRYRAPLDPNSYEGGPSATPTVDQGRVYTLGKRGRVLCLDALTGAVLWQRNLLSEPHITLPQWGLSGSPRVVDDTLVLNAGTHGLALHLADGSPAWSTGNAATGYSTPAAYRVGDTDGLVLLGRKTLAGVEAHSGRLLWEIPWEARYDENIADPLIMGDRLLVSSFLGARCSLFTLEPRGVTELWQHKDLLNWLNASVFWQGHLYGPDAKDKALKCLDPDSGQVLWSYPKVGLASCLIAGGDLIVLTDKGRLLIGPAQADGFVPSAQARILTGKCWTVPVLSHGRLYARNAAGELVCLDLSKEN